VTSASDEDRSSADALNPDQIVHDQRARVAEAIRQGAPEAARIEIETYLDLEERVLFDLLQRHAPDLDDEVEAARAEVERLLGLSHDDPDALAVEFVHHVERTDPLLDELWSRLDEAAAARAAAALEEARLSREEADEPLAPRAGHDER
jgi:hypothetical protein